MKMQIIAVTFAALTMTACSKEKEARSVQAEKSTPAKEAPAKEAPAKEAPVKETPVKETPVKETPVKETPEATNQQSAVPRLKFEIMDAGNYPGTSPGRVFFLSIAIHNLADEEIQIGSDMRFLMTNAPDAWDQFSMGGIAPLRPMKTPDDEDLKYQLYGSGALVFALQVGKTIGYITNGAFLIDGKLGSNGQSVTDWWPKKISPKETVTLTWPCAWSSDAKDEPQQIAMPVFTASTGKFYCWVNSKTGRSREILANSDSLSAILFDGAEEVGLRAAAVRWLLDCDPANSSRLLPLIQDKKVPKSISFRSIQALMVFGSPKILEEVFSLWTERKIVDHIDEDMKNYYSWSSHQVAKDYAIKVGADRRSSK